MIAKDVDELGLTLNKSDLEIIRNALLKYYKCYISDGIEGRSITNETVESLVKNHNRILHLAQLFECVVCLLNNDKNHVKKEKVND